MLIGGIILGLVVIVVVIFIFFLNVVLDLFQKSSGPLAPAATVAVTTPSAAPTSITVTEKPLSTAAAAGGLSQTLTPAAVLSPTASPLVTVSAPLTPVPTTDIQFDILSVEGSGFSWLVTGQLTNIGSAELHHAMLKIEMFSKNRTIENDSKPFVELDLGTFKAGAVVTEKVSIKLGVIDGLYVQANGVIFVLTFTSDEKTQTLRLDYSP